MMATDDLPPPPADVSYDHSFSSSTPPPPPPPLEQIPVVSIRSEDEQPPEVSKKPTTEEKPVTAEDGVESNSNNSNGIDSKQAIVVIQSAWRAWTARRAFLRERIAFQAQGLARGYLARKEYAAEYDKNRWRIEASKNATARLVSPVKNRASVRLSRKLPSRGHRPQSLPQAMADPIPNTEVSDSTGGDEQAEPAQEEEKKPVRKPMPVPGMMGIGVFDPSMVRLKSAPRLSLNLSESSSASTDNDSEPAPSFDMKRLKSAPRPVSESMLPFDPSKASQSPPPSRANLKPAPSNFNNEKTQSLPDIPAFPKLKPTAKSPLSSSPPASSLPPRSSKLSTSSNALELPPPVILPPPPADLPADLPPPILSSNHLGVPETAAPKPASPAVPKKPGPKMVLPPEWECHVDVQGRKYYHNTETEMTQWKSPPLVPESSIPKKPAPKLVTQQQPSQQNLFGHLEMLIPQHKFAPSLPKKPPPPPTGTPPPETRSSHSPAPSPNMPRASPASSPALPVPASQPSPAPSPNVATLPPPIAAPPPLSLNPPAQPPVQSSSSNSNIPITATTTTAVQHQPQPQQQPPPPQHTQSQSQLQHQDSQAGLPRQTSAERKDKRSALRKLLDAFLGRRPSKQELQQRNILPKDESSKALDKERKKQEKEKKKEEKKKGKK